MSKQKELEIIGINTLIDIGEHTKVPAKVDTGADSSAVWASKVKVNRRGRLSFVLFDKKSPYYTGKTLERKDFKEVTIRSSNGHTQDRYQVCIPIVVNGRKIRATFTLADRSKNTFPILIGRRALKHKFLVDVSRSVIPDSEPTALELSPESELMPEPAPSANTNTEIEKQPEAQPPAKAEDVKPVANTPSEPVTDSAQVSPQKPTEGTATKSAKEPAKKSSEQPAKKSTTTSTKKKLAKRSTTQAVLRVALGANDYKKIAPKKPRRLYFEKYKNSYALSNTLFRMYQLLVKRKVDLRPDFTKVYPLLRLHRLSERILTDPKALLYLSSYAVNIICLTEFLFPHRRDCVEKLARIALTIDPDAQPELYVELCTQIIIAESHYFTRPVSGRNKLLLRQLLRRASMYVDSFSTGMSKNVKRKFLACARLVGQEREYLEKFNRKKEKV